MEETGRLGSSQMAKSNVGNFHLCQFSPSRLHSLAFFFLSPSLTDPISFSRTLVRMNFRSQPGLAEIVSHFPRATSLLSYQHVYVLACLAKTVCQRVVVGLFSTFFSLEKSEYFYLYRLNGPLWIIENFFIYVRRKRRI